MPPPIESYAVSPLKTICTIVTDAADGKVLLNQGDSQTRFTPASTFKIPLAIMGFDSEFLTDAHAPVLPHKEGYADWGGDPWRQSIDPTLWMKYSVVWYSQVIAHELGKQRLSDYARKFGFGNADFSGDLGQNNGLDRSWIASSLTISPLEQTIFLRKLVTRQLSVSAYAMAETEKIIEISSVGDSWQLHGKTGTAYPRHPDRSFDEAHGYGWYVGWAVKGHDTLIFARLTQDEQKETTPCGPRARAGLLQEWEKITATL